ncbi:carboxymuconolactone decarboxylase family protein [Conexibacter arvalis]|uniref:AhpD family alkylhydroperoxidase n=1 Tax=Conexibacter arvalis TaxID=912552 RepID=A0A840IJ54_9ACTN|nr:carboxymuconolactone decarboxylase family protein [Conexibacter arvalis]MBB4663970.1 AhpD family alkylhydroperoxidase [Conexibacter arvalis]
MTSTAPLPSTATVVPRVRIASLPDAAPDNYKAMFALARSVRLDEELRQLIDIRVSQINGCAFCLDMHHADARRIGVADRKLDTVAAWRESPFFTARERAALDLAEAMTRLADDGHVADAVYDEAAAQFGEELPQVLFAITVINGWNRLMVAAQTPPLSFRG